MNLLANGLCRRGHEVLIATFYNEPGVEDQITCTPIKRVALFKSGKWDVKFLWRVRKFLQEIAPDCVYSFMPTANVTALLVKVLFPSRSTTKYVCGLRASNMDVSRYGLTSRVADFLQDQLLNRADAIICNAESTRLIYARKLQKPEILSVVPNGIDTKTFCIMTGSGARFRAEHEIPDDVLLIGKVARLDPMKGHETFLRAAQYFIANVRSDVVFLCIGGGNGAYKRSMTELQQQLGLDNHVLWLGELSELKGAYNAMEVLALTSDYGEGFPNVAGEAMACGTPVVCTDVGDSAAVVGDCGSVVPRGDYRAVATAWKAELAKNRDPRRAARIRQRVIDNFSVERMITGSMKRISDTLQVTEARS